MLPVARRGISSRFIGRAGPTALFAETLRDLTTDDATGRGAVLLVAGEAGVGKSRLVADWDDRARAAGASVLRGWCVEHGEEVLPLAPITDILRGAATASGTEQGDPPGPPVDDRTRTPPDVDSDPADRAARPNRSLAALSEGVLRVLVGLGLRRPVVLILEDLHWSDVSTRHVLTFLAPRVIGYPVALVLTYRSDELHRRHPLRPFLVSLRRAVRPEEIDLPPFTRPELADLVAAVTGVPPEPHLIRRLHDRCGGNAFFAEELLAGEVLGRPSAELRDAVLARTEGLDADAMTLLRMAGAAGPGVAVEVLAAASGLDADRFRVAVDSIVAAGLCVADVGRVSYRHELAREIVEDEMLGADRIAAHVALARALQVQTPHRMGEIARHWLHGGDRPAALQASVAAGRAATEIGADAEALTQFDRALELWELVPDPAVVTGCSHGDLLSEAMNAAGRARRFDRATTLGRQLVARAARRGPDAESAACLSLLPWAWFGVEDAELAKLLERAGRIVETPPGGRTALVLAWQAALALSEGRYARTSATVARPIAQQALDLARAAGHDQAQVHAELTLGACTCVEGDPRGLDEIRSVVARAKAGGLVMEAGRAYDNLAYFLSEFGRIDDVIDLEPEAIDYCTAAGIHRVLGVMVLMRAIRALQHRGRWSDVERRVEALRAEFGSLDIEHLSLADSWGLILVRQGRPDAVPDLIDATFERMGDHRSVIGPTTVTAVELVAASDDAARVRDLVDTALTRILPRFAESAAAVVAAGIRALADISDRSTTTAGPDHGDRATFRQDADGWLDRVQRAGPPPMLPWPAIAEAERSRLDDEPDPGRWQAAVDAWRGLGAPYESAYTHWRLAQALLTGPDRQSAETRARARVLMAGARRIADELGAAPLREQIDALAALAHLLVETAAPTAAVPEDGDRLGLTDREAEVLRLVARGYSNGQIGQALFISRKTASVHVSNILRKLGVSNRIEAATRSMRSDSDG